MILFPNDRVVFVESSPPEVDGFLPPKLINNHCPLRFVTVLLLNEFVVLVVVITGAAQVDGSLCPRPPLESLH